MTRNVMCHENVFGARGHDAIRHASWSAPAAPHTWGSPGGGTYTLLSPLIHSFSTTNTHHILWFAP